MGRGAEPLTLPGLPEGTAAADAAGETWVLAEHRPEENVGAVLHALDRHHRWKGAHIVASEVSADRLSFCLAAFAEPPVVWTEREGGIERRERPSLDEAARSIGRVAFADVADLTVAVPARSDAETLVAAIRDRHPDLLVEPAGDALAFTYLGLEVARLAPGEDALVFDVGVGEHDQDARRTVVGHRTVDRGAQAADLADLDHAVEVVRRHRRFGGPPHPLKRLRRSRWLRALVIDEPARASLASDQVLRPVRDLATTRSLRSDPPAPAVGTGEAVVCSVGIDLGLVPAAGTVWLQASTPESASWPRLTVVVPPRDDHPFTRALLARLVPEAKPRLVTVPFTGPSATAGAEPPV